MYYLSVAALFGPAPGYAAFVAAGRACPALFVAVRCPWFRGRKAMCTVSWRNHGRNIGDPPSRAIRHPFSIHAPVYALCCLAVARNRSVGPGALAIHSPSASLFLQAFFIFLPFAHSSLRSNRCSAILRRRARVQAGGTAGRERVAERHRSDKARGLPRGR